MAFTTIRGANINRFQGKRTLDRKAYKLNEVAQTLGLGRTTIYKLISQGELQKIKLGATTLISAESLDALLQRHAA